MVHRVEAAILLAPFEQRKVHDPEGCEHVRVAEAKTPTHLHAQYAELGLGLALLPAEHQYQIAGLCLDGGSNRLKILLAEELVHGGFECAVSVAQDID